MRYIFKPNPRDGARRIVTRFLIFPKTIENELRWWETTSWQERFNEGDMWSGSYWYALKWVEEDETKK